MARIIYGVCGQGFGHATRSKEAIDYLSSQGHQVKVVSFGQGYDWLKRYYDTENIFGLRMVYRDNDVKYWPTIVANVWQTPQALRSINKVKKIVETFKPRLLITDFEPITGLVANLKGLPFISLDNPHVLTRTDVTYPDKLALEALTAKLVVRVMILKADRYLILSFFPARATEPRTKVVPPIVRREVLALRPSRGDYFLAYFTSEADNLVKALAKSGQKCLVYGLNQNKRQGQLVFKKFTHDGFLRDLAGARAVVANAGFSLISEALWLRKPYLALPAHNQFEQFINGYQLQQLGYGLSVGSLDNRAIKQFTDRLPEYDQRLAVYPYTDNSLVWQALDKAIFELQ